MSTATTTYTAPISNNPAAHIEQFSCKQAEAYCLDKDTQTYSTVTFDGQTTSIAGTLSLQLQSVPGSGRKFLTADMKHTEVAASLNKSMACDDHDKGRYWFTEQVEIFMGFYDDKGGYNPNITVYATAPESTAMSTTVSSSTSTSVGASVGVFGTDPTATLSYGYSCGSTAAQGIPEFKVSNRSDLQQVHHSYQLSATPDVAYSNPMSLKHVHSGLNSGMVTLWSVTNNDGLAISDLNTPSQAVFITSKGDFKDTVNLTVRVVHHIAKIEVSKKKSGLNTHYHTHSQQVSYTYEKTYPIDFSKVADVTG